jgi:GTP-binding protein
MQILSAKFVVSNSVAKQCPATTLPEYAFIGRSNVGKSSLINMLCNNATLAKVSSTPGKTQLINHFLINDSWHLVDLPGYGYAKVSKSVKDKFQSLITDYVLNRQQLALLFVLVDCRHEPQKIDLEFMRFLGENGVPFSIIFTKSDKLKPGALERNIETYKQVMLEEWEELPPYFVTSSAHKEGKEDILNHIEQINDSL